MHLGKHFTYFICKLLCISQNDFESLRIFCVSEEYLLHFAGVLFDRTCFGFLRLFCALKIIFSYVSGNMLCITQNFFTHHLCVSENNILYYWKGFVIFRYSLSISQKRLCISHNILCISVNIFCISVNILCISANILRISGNVLCTYQLP